MGQRAVAAMPEPRVEGYGWRRECLLQHDRAGNAVGGATGTLEACASRQGCERRAPLRRAADRRAPHLLIRHAPPGQQPRCLVS
eukprot:scaffold218321_cov28-Tisochrysis_lutea.AAC.4